MRNCFADNGGNCVALKVKKCTGCNFYKTKKEALLGQLKVIKYIQSLNQARQDEINETYYGGKLDKLYKSISEVVASL